jgi:hypothetical protein
MSPATVGSIAVDEAGEAPGGRQLGEGDGGGHRGHPGDELARIQVPAMAARTLSTTWL